MPNRAGALLAAGSLMLLSACATDVRQMSRALDAHDTAIELMSVPFYAQTTDQCGPAALATIAIVVLSAGGLALRQWRVAERERAGRGPGVAGHLRVRAFGEQPLDDGGQGRHGGTVDDGRELCMEGRRGHQGRQRSQDGD